MPSSLDSLIAALSQAPPDCSLEGLAGGVQSRLADQVALRTEVWGLRAAVIAMVVVGGAAAGATSAADAPDPSPFAVWSTLAPSTLLGGV